MLAQLVTTYREEAGELLAELETSLLELEETPEDQDLINRVFRAMHTIKGSGAMFGFDDIAAFTHEVETVFDLVRNGKMVVTKELLDLTLKSRDHISALLDTSAGESASSTRPRGETLIAGLRRLAQQSEMTGKPGTLAPSHSSRIRRGQTENLANPFSTESRIAAVRQQSNLPAQRTARPGYLSDYRPFR